MTSFPTFRTERLSLRPYTLADAPVVQRLAGHPEVAATTLDMPHPYEDGVAEAWIETHRPEWEQGLNLILAVTTEVDGLVGTVSLRIDRQHRHGELGYWVGVPFWNRGYATEAARALVDYAFAELGLQRVFARHFERNPASGRVLEKIGMRREGVLRGHLRKEDHFEDVVVSGVLLAEWQEFGDEAGAPPHGCRPAWMRIQTSSSIEMQFDAHLRVAARRKRGKKREWWEWTFLLFLAVYALIRWPGGPGWKLIAAVFAVALWLAFERAVYFSVQCWWKRWIRKAVIQSRGTDQPVPIELELDEEALTHRACDQVLRTRWSSILEIDEKENDIEIWFRNGGLVLVGNEDFADDAQRAEWLRFARAHVACAAEASG